MVKTKKAGVQLKTTANKCTCCNGVLKKNKAHHIFDEYGKFRRIQFLLAECVQKKVIEVSGTVQAICSDCLNQLEQNYAFKLKCMSSRSDDNEIDEDDEHDEVEDDDGEGDEMQLEVKNETGIDDGDDIELDTLVKNEKEFVLEIIDDVDDAVPEEIEEIAKPTEIQTQQDQLEFIDTDLIDDDATLDSENVLQDGDVEHIDDDVEHIEEDVEHIEDAVEHIEDSAAYDSEHIKFDMDLDIVDGDANSTTNEDIVVYVAMETDKQAVCDRSDPQNPSAEQDADEQIIHEFTIQKEEDAVPELADSADSAPDELLFDPAKTFVECLTVHSIKEKIRSGIPVHAVRCGSDREPDEADESGDADQDSERRERSAAAASMLQLKEEVPIDVDEYVMSIVSVSFCEYSQFHECVMCDVSVE